MTEVFVGASGELLFGVLYDALKDLNTRNLVFDDVRISVESTLKSLEGVIKEIVQLKDELDGHAEEVAGLKFQLEEGKALLEKCLNVQVWRLDLKYKYSGKLLAWNERLQHHLEMLKPYDTRDGKKFVKGTDVKVDQMDSSELTNIFERAVTPLPLRSNDAALYSFLCDSHILLDDGNLSFSLQLQTSSYKKCWMLGAKHLKIEHITPNAEARVYWIRKSVPESRFSEVAELKEVWFFDIKGVIETNMLSPETCYAAYLVYRLEANNTRFKGRPIKLSITKEGRRVDRSILLDSLGDMAPKIRSDRLWMEQELVDEVFNRGDNATVEFRLLEDNTSRKKSGLIVEGIELRPKPV